MHSSLPIKILLAIPDEKSRKFVADILSRGSEFWIVGESNDAAERLRLASSLRPNIVVMSVDACEQQGVAATVEGLTQLSGVEVMVISSWNDHRDVESALRKGALGYMLEVDAATELLTGIREVTAGEVYVSSSVVGLWQSIVAV